MSGAIRPLQPSFGNASRSPSNIITYIPNPDFSGIDQLAYVLKDPSGAISNTSTVTLNVIPINDPPIANNDIVFIEMNTPATIDVLANDFDADVTDQLIISAIDLPNNGNLTVGLTSADYTPTLNFTGVEELAYTAIDQSGVESNANLTLVVYKPVTPKTLSGRISVSLSEIGTLEINGNTIQGLWNVEDIFLNETGWGGGQRVLAALSTGEIKIVEADLSIVDSGLIANLKGAAPTGDAFFVLSEQGLTYLIGSSSTLIDTSAISGSIQSIAASPRDRNLFAMTTTGSVWSLGPNAWGELGIGVANGVNDWTQISALNNVVQLATISNSTLALRGDGQVFYWGLVYFDREGMGNTLIYYAPTQINSISGATNIERRNVNQFTVQTLSGNFSVGIGNLEPTVTLQ